MKINDSSSDRLRALVDSLTRSDKSRGEGPEKASRSGSGTPGAAADQVDLSGLARDFARLRGSIDKTPAIREETVASLRDVIASGRYKVDDERLATLLADELLGA